MCCAVLVLFIACFNVANLLLGRASSRWAEMGLRMALGANRRVPIQLLLTEGLLLCLLGGLAGVGLAYACTSAMSAFNPPTSVPVHLQLSPDRTVLLLATLISMFCGLIVGIAPGIQATRTDPVVMVKGVSSSTSRKTAWFRNGLVVAQVTVSTLLLVSAGLLIQSTVRAQHADLGFQSDNLDIASIDVGFAGYDQARGLRAYQEILQRVNTIPGVVSTSLAQLAQLEFGTTQQMGVIVDSHQQRDLPMDYNIVSDAYFRTVGIPMLRGRDFSDNDNEHSPRVVIVNETFARRFFKGQDAIGKEIQLSGQDQPSVRIVGVVQNSRYYSVREDPMPFMFLPFLQNYQSGMVLHINARGVPSSVLAAVGEQVALVDPTIPVFRPRTMGEQVSTSLIELRIGVILVGVFGTLALILATMGLYAVMAYSVGGQRREIAMHIALGASRSNIMMMVFRRGGQLALFGIVLGLLLSLPFGTLLTSLLYGIKNADPIVMLCVAVLIAITALLASFVPAWRAMRIDPAAVLRSE
jgi:predicted permease